MKVSYITIEREYGSGGTKIARTLAEQTGIPCYGSEILDEVSRRYGVSVDEIEKYEETVSNSLLYSMFVLGQAAAGKQDMLSREGHIFVAEQQVIQAFARQGRAIFLGHCACEALKDFPGVVKAFIRCSDPAARQKRIVEEYGIAPERAEATRKRFDKKRANYYSANTTKKWDNHDNYDIVLDSGMLGTDGCVSALKGFLI